MLIMVTVGEGGENGDQRTKGLVGFGKEGTVSGEFWFRMGFGFHGRIVAEKKKKAFFSGTRLQVLPHGWDVIMREAAGDVDLMRLIG